MSSVTGDLILYRAPDGAVRAEVRYEGDTFWLSQRQMAELFGVDVRTVNEHLRNIYASGELSEEATIRNFRIVRTEGSREVAREIVHHSLDAIISVGYRVNSVQATRFRIWATDTLREFIVKGFVLDDERLKLNTRFGPDYFDELQDGAEQAALGHHGENRGGNHRRARRCQEAGDGSDDLEERPRR